MKTLSALLPLVRGIRPLSIEPYDKRSLKRAFDDFFDVSLYKLLNITGKSVTLT